MFKNKLVLLILVVVPLLAITAATVLMLGVRRFGTPSEYREQREQQERLMQAREDSLRAVQSLETDRNRADSTLFGMSGYAAIVQQTEEKRAELNSIQASIDSLLRLREELQAQEARIDQKQGELETSRQMLQDENVQKLASLYDNMKTPMAVPLFLEMNDTLAVKILSFMDERNAAQIMGSLAEQNVDKAARLNNLMSMTEAGQ